MEFIEPAALFSAGAGAPSRGLLDVRAPVEVAAGALPFALNLPILTTEERHRVGLRYKAAGQAAALELGEALTRADLPRRVAAWREVCAASPTAVMCWRGGLRSRLAQEFIGQASQDVPRVRGGYKALRRHLVDSLEPSLARKRTLTVTGLTGSGKTDLLARLRARPDLQVLDLEGAAKHRGSAFGLGTEPQPSQATFENSLAAQVLLNPSKVLVVEDESRSVGRRSVPTPLFEAMMASPVLVLETTLDDRVQRIFRDYIERATEAAGAAATLAGLEHNLGKLRPRLGNVTVDRCLFNLREAYHAGAWLTPEAHFETIRTLLEDYYDPLYRKSVQKLARPVLARGTQEALATWLETPLPSVTQALNKPVRLTQTVGKGGCAAKIAAGTLSQLLASLPRQQHPDLLVGTDFLDDAAVWRVSDDVALIQTLDFFTPILDDPFDFGAVAAANALSDVFAMGGTPQTALTILAYPLDTLPPEVLSALMAGALEKINEAGALLVGGHSIDDDTLKLGFSVTGFARPGALWSNRGARPGDALLLTKAVGTGTLAGALKNDELSYADLGEAVASMKTLNRLDLGALRGEVHAATDVTGFGLLGHALHLAEGAGVTLHLAAEAVPLLAHAADTLSRGVLTKAHRTNTLYVQDKVSGRDKLTDVQWWSLVDPQTSGGLLLSVAPDNVAVLLEHVRETFPRAAVVGEVLERGETALRVA